MSKEEPYLSVRISPARTDGTLSEPLADFVRRQLRGLLKTAVLYDSEKEVSVRAFRLIGDETLYPIDSEEEGSSESR